MKKAAWGSLLLAPALLCIWTQLAAQEIGQIQRPLTLMWVKSENGLVIAWERKVSTDAQTSTIHLFDKAGHNVAAFDVLHLVPEAKSVSIHDVSARPQQVIAVAATYEKQEDELPVSVLLYLDSRGTLLSALALDPSREVLRLALDENLNTWTLTHASGGIDPSKAPLVTEYNQRGIVREVLTRNLFPLHAEEIHQNPLVGAATAGYDSGTFWFWLPGSTDFVTIRVTDGTVTGNTQTGLPRLSGLKVTPLQIVREASGNVIAEVRTEAPGPNANASLAYYIWSPDTKSWSPFAPQPCANHRLVGVDGSNEIFFGFNTMSSICSFTR